MAMSTYLDTSFLLKLYVWEQDSASALDAFPHFSESFVSTLTDVEIASALFRKLPTLIARRVHSMYKRDRAASVFLQIPLTDQLYELAQQLVEQHSGDLSLRSLDALHLATALHYGAASLATYDRRLRIAAERVGLSTLPTRP